MLARREAGYDGYLSIHVLEPLLGYREGWAVPAASRRNDLLPCSGTDPPSSLPGAGPEN